MIYINKPVPGSDQYYPLNEPEIASVLSKDVFPQNKHVPKLLSPITIRGVTFQNKVFVSPMCQYSSDNGHATDWHLVHIGGYATRGLGGIVIEATAVEPEGRISPEDAGIWTDSQIAPLQRIVNFVHAQGSKVGVQLAHAGRKASTLAPWVYANAESMRRAPKRLASKEEGGWPDDVVGSSDIPFADGYAQPRALTEEGLQRIERAFISAAERSKKAGLDFIELHFAHGYLLHTFLSPLSNTRGDNYGGQPLENRLRWPLILAKRIREVWADKPLFVRISATDWADELGPERAEDGTWRSWGLEQSKVFVGELQNIGIDLIDVSSGGLWAKQKIEFEPGYQVPFAKAIKKTYPDLLIGTVGLITSPTQAESYLEDGKADVVFLARELIRNPHWVLTAAQELGTAIKPANQYERGWPTVLTPEDARK